MFKKFCDYFLTCYHSRFVTGMGRSSNVALGIVKAISRKLRIKLVVCKCSYAAVARLDWYRRLTSGFSDVARNRPDSERHSWTEVGTKLLVHHFLRSCHRTELETDDRSFSLLMGATVTQRKLSPPGSPSSTLCGTRVPLMSNQTT